MLQKYHSTNRSEIQDRLGYTNLVGREEAGSQARYIEQLNNMLSTARRNKWQRVVFALSSLIVKRGGIA